MHRWSRGRPDAAIDHKGPSAGGHVGRGEIPRHKDGRLRAVEVRGADYVGAGVGGNGHITRASCRRATKGKAAWVIGKPRSGAQLDRRGRHGPGRWPRFATEESSWGRIWHAPSNPPRTQAQAVNDVLASVGKATGEGAGAARRGCSACWRRSCR